MKHSINVTIYLILLFLISQLLGLYITSNYIDVTELDKGNVTFSNLPYDIDRPEIEESTSFIHIFTIILIGTGLVFLLIKFQLWKFWKILMIFAVFVTLLISFNAFIPTNVAFGLAIILALWKILKPNVIIHNLTEIFIYGGIAALLVPKINLISSALILILLAIYDYISVYKTKHMVTLANSQAEQNIFAGLMIPYNKNKVEFKISNKSLDDKKHSASKVAILGGGDMGFPLIFTGVVMKGLLLTYGITMSILLSSIISIVTAISLFILIYLGDQGKFYPAIPVLSAGCFIGYGIMYLVTLFI